MSAPGQEREDLIEKLKECMSVDLMHLTNNRESTFYINELIILIRRQREEEGRELAKQLEQSWQVGSHERNQLHRLLAKRYGKDSV